MCNRPKPDWVALAAQELESLRAAAKASPKEFYGNKIRGMGDGLKRIQALAPALRNLNAVAGELNRVL